MISGIKPRPSVGRVTFKDALGLKLRVSRADTIDEEILNLNPECKRWCLWPGVPRLYDAGSFAGVKGLCLCIAFGFIGVR